MSSGPSALLFECNQHRHVLVVLRVRLTRGGTMPPPSAQHPAQFDPERRSYRLLHLHPLSINVSLDAGKHLMDVECTVLVQAQGTARMLHEKIEQANLVLSDLWQLRYHLISDKV